MNCRAPIRRNKFGVRLDAAGKRARTYKGMTFHSKLEADFARRLDMLRTAQHLSDRVVHWNAQVRVPLIANGTRVCVYVVDFIVAYADGRSELVECKGRWTSEARLKFKLFRALFPDEKIRIAERV